VVWRALPPVSNLKSVKRKDAPVELTGSRTIKAPRAEVWAALNSSDVLKACIPGCQELSGSPQDGFEATVMQKVGPVKATFKGAVQFSDVVEGVSYRIAGEGKGGAAGFAKGGADVRLADTEDGGTELTYDVQASVGGKLAQLGSRIVDGFAKKMADQFFDKFRAEIEGPSADGDAAPEEAKKKSWLGRITG
jgi:carbon monoxide dehydrogenase subunit G